MPRPLRVQYCGAIYQHQKADLNGLSFGCPEKVALAWCLRKRTTVSLRWVAEHLMMGQYTRVSQAMSHACRKPGKDIGRLCKQLEREIDRA
jgi:hypothetical protein